MAQTVTHALLRVPQTLRGGPFIAEFADCLAQAGVTPVFGAPPAGLNARQTREILFDRPLAAAFAGAARKKRMTLALTGARALPEALARRLAGLRILCFDWSTYTRLRKLDLDAALFVYAPAPSAPAGAPTFFARGTGRRIDEDFLRAMAAGRPCEIPARSPFHAQYLTHGVNGLIAGRAPLAASPARRGEAAAQMMAALRRDFLADRARLAAFALGLPIDRRAPARVDWAPAAAATTSPATPDALEGGRRLTAPEASSRAARAPGPRVSVAIVMWNVREAFEKTLASVLAQTYANCEIVVVDGGSTDGSLDVLRARDGQIDDWISEKDRGPYDAMNKAAARARGDFLIYMNAGDYFPHDNAISDAFAADAARAADIVIGHHVYVDGRGVARLQKAVDFEETWAAISSGALSFEWMEGVPCGQAVFISTRILRALPFDLSFRIAADHNLLYCARQNGARFFHCGMEIGVYTAGGLSGANDAKTARELLRLAQTFGPPEKAQAWFARNLPLAFDAPPAGPTA